MNELTSSAQNRPLFIPIFGQDIVTTAAANIILPHAVNDYDVAIVSVTPPHLADLDGSEILEAHKFHETTLLQKHVGPYLDQSTTKVPSRGAFSTTYSLNELAHQRGLPDVLSITRVNGDDFKTYITWGAESYNGNVVPINIRALGIYHDPIIDHVWNVTRGFYNIHPGLLNSSRVKHGYRGIFCPAHAMANGEDIGATLHEVRRRIDYGDVYQVAASPGQYAPDDTVLKAMMGMSSTIAALANRRLDEMVSDQADFSGQTQKGHKAKYYDAKSAFKAAGSRGAWTRNNVVLSTPEDTLQIYTDTFARDNGGPHDDGLIGVTRDALKDFHGNAVFSKSATITLPAVVEYESTEVRFHSKKIEKGDQEDFNNLYDDAISVASKAASDRDAGVLDSNLRKAIVDPNTEVTVLYASEVLDSDNLGEPTPVAIAISKVTRDRVLRPKTIDITDGHVVNPFRSTPDALIALRYFVAKNTHEIHDPTSMNFRYIGDGEGTRELVALDASIGTRTPDHIVQIQLTDQFFRQSQESAPLTVELITQRNKGKAIQFEHDNSGIIHSEEIRDVVREQKDRTGSAAVIIKNRIGSVISIAKIDAEPNITELPNHPGIAQRICINIKGPRTRKAKGLATAESDAGRTMLALARALRDDETLRRQLGIENTEPEDLFVYTTLARTTEDGELTRTFRAMVYSDIIDNGSVQEVRNETTQTGFLFGESLRNLLDQSPESVAEGSITRLSRKNSTRGSGGNNGSSSPSANSKERQSSSSDGIAASPAPIASANSSSGAGVRRTTAGGMKHVSTLAAARFINLLDDDRENAQQPLYAAKRTTAERIIKTGALPTRILV